MGLRTLGLVEAFAKLWGNKLSLCFFLWKHHWIKKVLKSFTVSYLSQIGSLSNILTQGGGLALIWKEEVLLDVINFTANHILAKVKEEDGFKWFLTCFYGWLEANQRDKSWKLLSHLKNFMDGPSLYIGDFNAFLHALEKLRKQPLQICQVNAFWGVLDLCWLDKLGFRGNLFTWSNKWPRDANMKVRLDRAMATKEWREKY